jgi:hypothetical protein
MAVFPSAIIPQFSYPIVSSVSVPLGAITTYYFRRTDGTRGSATSIGSIPAGAVVERIVTA